MDANSFAEFIVEKENRFGRGKTDLKTRRRKNIVVFVHVFRET